jgi:hypothetical protein
MAENEISSPLERLTQRIGARSSDESQEAGSPKEDKSPTPEPGQQQLSAYERFIQRFVKPTDKPESGEQPGEQQPGQQQPGELQLIEIQDGQVIPKDAKDYLIPGEDQADKDLVTWFREKALALGLSKKQTAHLVQFHSAKFLERTTAQANASKMVFDAVTGDLKTTWGPDYESNSKAINEATKGMSDAQFTGLIHKLLLQHVQGQRK